MKKEMDYGVNRTGVGASPTQAKQLIEGAREGIPSSPGDESMITALRVLYSKEAPYVGTIPTPTAPKGASPAIINLLRSPKCGVFLDKLGERLCFQRACIRMYDALMAKFRAYGTWQGGPSIQDLMEVHHDKLRHFEHLRNCFVRLGADPTAMVPSADLACVEAMGVVQVMTDPRTRPAHCLQAMLIAELADHDGWGCLVELADTFGQEEFANQMRVVLSQEQRHVSLVRVWLRSYVMGEEGTLELDEIRG